MMHTRDVEGRRSHPATGIRFEFGFRVRKIDTWRHLGTAVLYWKIFDLFIY